MRPLLLFLGLCALACASPATKDEAADADADGRDEDTDVESFEGDDAGECVDGADNDRDGDFDCDDEDCAGSPDCEGETEDTDVDTEDAPDVTWVGVVVVNFWAWDGDARCENGTFTLTIDGGSGVVDGEASCDLGWELGESSGPLSGQVRDGVFTGTWETSFGHYDMDVELEGTADDRAFRATFAVDGDELVEGSFTSG